MQYHFLIRNETPQNFVVEADKVTVKMTDEVPVVEATKGGKVCATFFVDALTGYMPASAFQKNAARNWIQEGRGSASVGPRLYMSPRYGCSKLKVAPNV